MYNLLPYGDGTTFFVHFIFGVFFWLKLAYFHFNTMFSAQTKLHVSHGTVLVNQHDTCTLFHIHTITFFHSISLISLIFYSRFSHLSIFIDLVFLSQTLTTTKILPQNWHFLLINCYSFFFVFYFCSTISIGNFHLFKTNKNNSVENTWTHLHKNPHPTHKQTNKSNTCTHNCTTPK